jgi:CheY-like chemotaxis protein
VTGNRDVIAGALVLVIDDEQAALDGMAALLTGWGCRALLATSVGEALERVAGAGGRPDVILADYRLRDGETGVGAIARVHRAVGAPVPAVLVTGDTAPDRLYEARSSGLELLHKPVRPARLRALLADLLGR